MTLTMSQNTNMNMNDNRRNIIPYTVSVAIKLTSPPYRALYYNFNSTISTKNMFEYLSTKIRDELGLMSYQYHIVVYEDPQNIPCDRNIIAPIAEQFRLSSRTNNSIVLCINLIEQEEQEQPSIAECPVCLEQETPSRLFVLRYICGHPICSDCFRRCIQSNNRVCPLCRQAELQI